ncbi:MAG TPA: hypothetical protein VFV38_13260 [Ktedonobacteraceae bacterium]|nr:hypothetical protein [Ktedonobacteraceae bacterium]
MHVTETEIILPLSVIMERVSRRDLISPCLVGILLLGAGLFFLFPPAGSIPTTNNGPLVIVLIILAMLFLLPSVTLLVMIWQSERSRSSRFVRINHEGFLFSYLFPTVITWGEISSLVPYTQLFLGRSYTALGIIPHDPEAILTRITDVQSKGFFSRWLWKIDLYFYRRSKALSPLRISQAIVSIPMEEFLALIQERFGRELREHGIALLGWQEGNR